MRLRGDVFTPTSRPSGSKTSTPGVKEGLGSPGEVRVRKEIRNKRRGGRAERGRESRKKGPSKIPSWSGGGAFQQFQKSSSGNRNKDSPR